jgi:hypothetical protein
MTILCNLEFFYWAWLLELQNQRGQEKKKKNLEKIKIKHLIYLLTSSSCVNYKITYPCSILNNEFGLNKERIVKTLTSSAPTHQAKKGFLKKKSLNLTRVVMKCHKMWGSQVRDFFPKAPELSDAILEVSFLILDTLGSLLFSLH